MTLHRAMQPAPQSRFGALAYPSPEQPFTDVCSPFWVSLVHTTTYTSVSIDYISGHFIEMELYIVWPSVFGFFC